MEILSSLNGILQDLFWVKHVKPGSKQLEDLFGLVSGTLTGGGLIAVDVIIRTTPLSCSFIRAMILVACAGYRIVR